MRKLKYTLILVLTLLIGGLYGQLPQLNWDKTIGGNYAEGMSTILPALDGDGFYLMGSSSSNVSGEKTAPPYTMFGTDIWIVKYNSNWEKQWDKVIGGTLNEGLSSVLQLIDGGFLLGITSFSNASGDKSEDTRGNSDSDYWIVKIDKDANVEWERTIGGADFDDLNGMFYHPDGGFLLAGTSYSGKSGDKSHDSFGNQDIWIVHIDWNGKILWDKVYGGERFDIGGGLFPLDDGFIVTGKSDSPPSGNKTATKRGAYDAWMFKIDFNGNMLWDKAFGGSENESGVGITIAHDGGYLLSITSKSDVSGDKTSPDIGGNDAWFVKVDDSWNIEWDKTLGTLEEDALGAIKTADGGYLLTGTHTIEIIEDGGISTMYADRWMKLCDANLNETWDYRFGGDKDDAGGGMWIMENDSTTVLMGSTSNSNISGEKTEDSRGGHDFWLTQFKLPVGLVRDFTFRDFASAVNVTEAGNVSVFPNPVNNGVINIVSEDVSIQAIDLISITGERIKSFSHLYESSISIPIRDVPAGMYLLKSNLSNGKNRINKIIIQ